MGERLKKSVSRPSSKAVTTTVAISRPGTRRKELRQLLGQYVTYLLGRQPRLLSYLGS